ncbi:hypothetical protein SAMN05216553_109266 [Lentzea fradiae]|uniref:N-acetyltransferase domain-containing protein n=1 Tax=Lentzea fradiae TaxID=200378 RepID=A0A1G7VJE7_9PSEU|nr:hypothetical protein [Lentzea fradiae]SDG59807.1 hypothetical protein SAMN05216553_109266 [Lentzea fradiae]
MTSTGYRWEMAADPAEVHDLLCASDRFQAERTGTAAPVRNPAGTAAHVAAGRVHLLRDGELPTAMFTLVESPPFDEPPDAFPPAVRPVYLTRLAVRPEAAGSLAGMMCVRRAIATATGLGADAVRCEANPGLAHTVELLQALGFVLADQREGSHVVHLHRPLGR